MLQSLFAKLPEKMHFLFSETCRIMDSPSMIGFHSFLIKVRFGRGEIENIIERCVCEVHQRITLIEIIDILEALKERSKK